MQIENVADAFELQQNKDGMVMQTKHCLKYAFGQCPRYVNPQPEKLLEENFKMLAQDANRAGHRSIEIDMQIADEKVVHALNLYSRLVTVKGWIARRFSLKCGD
jgi:hypothetical protein